MKKVTAAQRHWQAGKLWRDEQRSSTVFKENILQRKIIVLEAGGEGGSRTASGFQEATSAEAY